MKMSPFPNSVKLLESRRQFCSALNYILPSKLAVYIFKVMRWHWMDSIDPPLLNLHLVLVVLTWLPNDDIQMKGSHKS